MTLQGRDDMLRDLKCILEGKEAALGFNRAGEALCFGSGWKMNDEDQMQEGQLGGSRNSAGD